MSSKTYLYKVYEGENYLGMLAPDKVISDFSYSQDINNAGTEINITLGYGLDDVGATVDSDTVTDENDLDITDEFGSAILAFEDYVFTTVDVNLGRRIVVTLFYENAINGTEVFDGIITTWRSDETAQTIELTVQSNGVQLDNYLIATPPGTLLVSQELNGGSGWTVRTAPPDALFNYALVLGQTFTVPSNTTVSKFELWVWKQSGYAGTPMARLTLQYGTPDNPGSVISTVKRTITSSSTSWVAFSLPESVQLLTATTYSITLTVEDIPATAFIAWGFKPSNPYANGAVYQYLYATGWTTTTDDFQFRIYSGNNNIGRAFPSQDPSAILRSLISAYSDSGGLITYDSTSIDDTNSIVQYTFKANTVFDGVRKVVELAPANWYWYVDPGTNLLHFHRIGTNPDHTFTVGEHIMNLNIARTLDDVTNLTYFTGGDTGSSKLALLTANPGSSSKYGQWLQLMNDNRVTDSDTAEILSRGAINQNSSPVFRTEVEILAKKYDIETIQLGDIVCFSNANDFVTSLRLLVAGISRRPDSVKLRLATNPPSVSHRIEDIKRNLDNLYNVDNTGI